MIIKIYTIIIFIALNIYSSSIKKQDI